MNTELSIPVCAAPSLQNAEKVLDMLKRAEVLDVCGYLIHNWELGTMDGEDDEEVFACSFTDEEGLIFEFSYTKKALTEAKIVQNSIEMMDDTGELVNITCYTLTPLN